MRDNGTPRRTHANQSHSPGLGSAAPGKNSRSLQSECSVANFLNKNLAVGAGYRFKPDSAVSVSTLHGS